MKGDIGNSDFGGIDYGFGEEVTIHVITRI
jgi:hypothetical protein